MVGRYGLVMALLLASETARQVRAVQPNGGVRGFVVTTVQELWLANGYPGVRGETAPVRFETSIWYAAPDRWRIERSYITPPAEPALVGVFMPQPTVTVRNGPLAWTYDASSHTYVVRSPHLWPVRPRAAPLPFEAAALGEPFPSTAHSLPALLTGLAACDTAKIVPISRPTIVGRARVRGRLAYVIDFGRKPCGWTSASAYESMGRRLIWVDQQTFFVLKSERYSVYRTTRLFARTTVTGLQYNVAIPASRFVFTPPPGAHRAPAASSTVAAASVKPLAAIRRQVSFPPVLPTRLPDGLRLQHTTVDGAQHVTIDYTAGGAHLSILEGPLGCCLDADPRKYGGPTLPDGRPVNLLDVGASFGGLILWWDQGGAYIALSNSSLRKAQLMQVALSLSTAADSPHAAGRPNTPLSVMTPTGRFRPERQGPRAVGASTFAAFSSRRSARPTLHDGAATVVSPAPPAASVSLERPGPLAVGPTGTLYIADDARNQILARASDGRFVVIAGTGQAGFSGDGRRATDAQVHTPGGMVMTRDGTLYFADSANGRVRAISRGGVLSTVAGSGRCGGWVADGTPARKAPLCWPADLTIGPDGQLYIADEGANAIFHLTATGTLRRIAGSRSAGGVFGIGKPATQASADGPSALAFDRSGDLYIAGQNTKTVLMITHNHIMTRPYGGYGFYPHGDAGLVAGRDGSVIAMASQEIIRLTRRSMHPIIDFSRNHLLGRRDAFLPNGIAVAPDGMIYTDTWAGNGWTTITALVAFRPGTAAAQVLWKSR